MIFRLFRNHKVNAFSMHYMHPYIVYVYTEKKTEKHHGRKLTPSNETKNDIPIVQLGCYNLLPKRVKPLVLMS